MITLSGQSNTGNFNAADMPSPLGWKARLEKSDAKREARSAENAMRAKYHSAISDRDRAADTLRVATERRDTLVRNRDAKKGTLEVYQSDLAQSGQVHPAMMSTAYAIEQASIAISAAEQAIIDAKAVLGAAQARYDAVMAEPVEDAEPVTAETVDDAEPAEAKRGPGRPRKVAA